MRDDTGPSVLEDMDDPQYWASNVSSEWRVTEKLQIGERCDDGRVTSWSYLIVSPGDFVDVGVTVNIVNRGGRGIAVQLIMTHVLQLLAASRVLEVRRTILPFAYWD